MRRMMPFCRTLLAAAAFVLAWVTAGEAATLYEHSLPLLEARGAKTSPRDFTFVVLGDSRGNDAVFRRSLALAATFSPLFVLHGGDVGDAGSAAELERFLALVSQEVPAIPLFVVAGNHERDQKLFRAKIGPLDYTLTVPRLGLKLVVLDNSRYALKPAQLDYLRGELAGNRGTSFVAMHIPPKTARWSGHSFTDGAADLIRIMTDGKVATAFFAHIHLYDEDRLGGVPCIISGGAGAVLDKARLAGTPVYHIVVVTVKDGVVSSRMVPVPAGENLHQ